MSETPTPYSEPKFPVGTVVRLKSGGPKMTVNVETDCVLNCIFMLPNGEFRECNVSRQVIEIVDSDEP